MRKSDLKTGMLVTTRSGDHYYVMLHTNLFGDEENILLHPCGNSMGWMPLSQYHDDLTFHSMPDEFLSFPCDPDVDKAWDIVKVEAVNHAVDLFRTKNYTTIWERSDIPASSAQDPSAPDESVTVFSAPTPSEAGNPDPSVE